MKTLLDNGYTQCPDTMPYTHIEKNNYGKRCDIPCTLNGTGSFWVTEWRIDEKFPFQYEIKLSFERDDVWWSLGISQIIGLTAEKLTEIEEKLLQMAKLA